MTCTCTGKWAPGCLKVPVAKYPAGHSKWGSTKYHRSVFLFIIGWTLVLMPLPDVESLYLYTLACLPLKRDVVSSLSLSLPALPSPSMFGAGTNFSNTQYPSSSMQSSHYRADFVQLTRLLR